MCPSHMDVLHSPSPLLSRNQWGKIFSGEDYKKKSVYETRTASPPLLELRGANSQDRFWGICGDW